MDKNKEITPSSKKEDFDVVIVSKADDDTVVLTSPSTLRDEKLRLALSVYNPDNKKYSAYLNEGMNPSTSITIEDIEEWSTNPQNDLQKVLRINAYNRKLINKNDIVGKTVESIDTNINTEIKLTYSQAAEGRNKKKKFQECEAFIKGFNDSIKIKQVTRNAITTPYIEGNWIAYLRHDDPTNYTVDIYPLGVCEISESIVNGEPLILFNVRELRTRLRKTYRKTKKQKPLIFKDMEEEIRKSYPAEVYKAFKDGEDYAILDYRYTGVIRINNLNRRYGVSPLLRAYTDLLMLDTFADSDRINSKAKGKKIIHQKMRKETMGVDYGKDFFPELSYAHQNFMESWKQSTVVVTSPPTVESIAYVEPKVEMTSKDTYNIYRAKVLSTLGIQFLMDSGSQSVSTASISVTQLMRTINVISEQFEDILKKWYHQVLVDNNFPVEYTPDVKVIDSEQLEMAMKIDLASFLYNTMNASLQSCYEVVGMDVNDEAQKRKKEKELGYDEIFTPRLTAYTNSGGNQTETTTNTTTDPEKEGKQAYDKERNANKG